MTPAEHAAAGDRLRQRTRAAQGLPPTINDAEQLRRVAAILAGATKRGGDRRARAA